MGLTAKKLIKKYQVRLSKRLGQNFLIDKKVIKKFIRTADSRTGDIILEIGPGFGALTREIAKKAGKVIAVEKDKRIAEILKEETKDFKNVEIINKDILKLNFPGSRGMGRNYKIAANLPFCIAIPVIRKFLEAKNPPEEMILIVQKEIAQKICSKPPKMSILAISVLFYAEAKIIGYISKESFWPKPKVDSAIIKITPNQRRFAASPRFRGQLFKIIKAGFSQPRKQLAGNLANKLNIGKEEVKRLLLKNNIQPDQRAETLTIKDWIKLAKNFH